MKLGELPTPALIVDRGIVGRNTAAMTERMRRHGVALRPHLKTAKSVAVARLATDGNAGGLTVSTLQEAEYFAGHGFQDLTYAVGIVPDRVDRAAALVRDGARLHLITDDAAVARAVSERAASAGVVFPVLIEVDCGGGRAGVDPEGPELLEIGGVLHAAEGVELAGVLTHAGHSYECRDVAAIRRVAAAERGAAVRAATRLREAGLPCQTVSVGSTPTAVHAGNLE